MTIQYDAADFESRKTVFFDAVLSEDDLLAARSSDTHGCLVLGTADDNAEFTIEEAEPLLEYVHAEMAKPSAEGGECVQEWIAEARRIIMRMKASGM